MSNPLSYAAPSKSGGRRARRWVVGIVGLGFLLSTGILIVVKAAWWLDHTKYWSATNVAWTPGNVMYVDRELWGNLDDPSYDSQCSWINLVGLTSTKPGQATLFLGRLHAPGSPERFIEVDCGDRLLGRSGPLPNSVVLTYRVVEPGTRFYPPRLCYADSLGISLANSQHGLKIYGAAIDPADARHITIRYECGTSSGVIDGWLEPGDRMVLEPRQ